MTDDTDHDEAANRPAAATPEAVLRQVVRATQAQLAAILVDLEQQPEAPFADREWAFFQTLATALQRYADATRRAFHRSEAEHPPRDPGRTLRETTPMWWLAEPTPEDGEG